MKKKAFSIILIFCILLSVFTGCSVQNGAGTTETTDDYIDDGVFRPEFRMVVCSDTHITVEENERTGRLRDMLKQVNDYAASNPDNYNKLDALCIVGDVAHDGIDVQWELAKKILDEGLSDETELVITTGNHDYGRYKQESKTEFEKIFGANVAQQHVEIGGYHFITVNFDDRGRACSNDVVQWLETELAKAYEDTGDDEPIFVFQHIGNQKTVFGTCPHFSEKSCPNLNPVLAKYPNIVDFSGHCHYLLNDECMIHQKDFTAIGTGTLNYTMPLYNNGMEITIPNKTEVSQVWIIEMDGRHKMRLRVWDVLQEKFLGEDRFIEAYNKENFVYTEDRYTKEDLFFAEGAVPTVTKVTKDTVELEFPRVAPESINGRVYRVDLWTADGKSAGGQVVGLTYFDGKDDAKVTAEFTGLTPNTEYTAKVFAINSLYCSDIANTGTKSYSLPIEVTFKTK